MSPLRLTVLTFVVVIVAMVALASFTPRPLNWTHSYSKSETIPFGCSLLFDVLPEVFPGQQVHVDDVTAFESRRADYSSYRSAELYVTDRFQPDKQSEYELLRYCDRGGVVFIAAMSMSRSLCDSLHVSLSYGWCDTSRFELVHPQLPTKLYGVALNGRYSFIDSVPDSASVILGRTDKGRVNYLRIARGHGFVYLHTDPLLFSNYVVSDSSLRPYVFAALSLVPLRECWWDEYYKPLHHDDGSLFRVVFSDSRLRISYYLIFVLVALFLLFHTKRYQRIVPIMKAPINATLDFVGTVGRLYFQHRDSRSIIQKMIVYFQDYLRSRYYLSDVSFSEQTIEKVAAKSNQQINDVRQSFQAISKIQNTPVPVDKDVEELYRVIDEFKKRAS